MAKGYPGMGGGNMNNMIKQAQKMQREMLKMQEDLENKEIEASAGGVVSVKINGKKQFTEIKIDPAAVDPGDVEMLEDLVMVAVNDALRKLEEISSTEMSKLTGGMNLTGLF